MTRTRIRGVVERGVVTWGGWDGNIMDLPGEVVGMLGAAGIGRRGVMAPTLEVEPPRSKTLTAKVLL